MLGFEIFGKAGHHGGADAGADKDIEHHAAFAKRLVDSDMRGPKTAAAGGDEADRPAAQKADKAVDIDLVFEGDMVMHEGRQPGQPGRGARDLAASMVMNADETSGRDGMNLAGKGLDLSQCGGRRIAAAREHDHVGLTDGLARPWRSVAAAEINHQRRGVFELVEPFGDVVCIERAPGKHRLEAGGVDNLGIDRGKPLAHPAIESARQRLQSAVDQRHRSRLRRGGEWRDARGLLGEPPRQRSQQRLDDGGGFLDQLLVGRTRQCQHAGVADGDHISRARDIGEEADLAHQLAGPELGDRLEIAGLAHRERTMQHQEKRIRGPALRDQHLPAHQILADHGVERLQPLFGTERSKQRELLQRGAPRKYRARSTHLAVPS